jgi:hypothetical protein
MNDSNRLASEIELLLKHPIQINNIMKTSLCHLATVGVLGIALTFTSCVSPYYDGGYYGGPGPEQQRGTVVGAFGGGAVGGIIGNQSGRGLEGAAIGALLGGLAGSSLGASNDQRFHGNNVGYYGRPAPVVYHHVGYGYGGPVGFGNSCYGGRSSYSSVSLGSGFGSSCGPRGFGGGPFIGGGYSRGFGNSCW